MHVPQEVHAHFQLVYSYVWAISVVIDDQPKTKHAKSSLRWGSLHDRHIKVLAMMHKVYYTMGPVDDAPPPHIWILLRIGPTGANTTRIHKFLYSFIPRYKARNSSCTVRRAVISTVSASPDHRWSCIYDFYEIKLYARNGVAMIHIFRRRRECIACIITWWWWSQWSCSVWEWVNMPISNYKQGTSIEPNYWWMKNL